MLGLCDVQSAHTAFCALSRRGYRLKYDMFMYVHVYDCYTLLTNKSKEACSGKFKIHTNRYSAF